MKADEVAAPNKASETNMANANKANKANANANVKTQSKTATLLSILGC